jgi:hypothetical protein
MGRVSINPGKTYFEHVPLVGKGKIDVLRNTMNRKKRRYDLPEEILTVLQGFTNLEPRLKFRNANIVSFVKHTHKDKCEQCLYLRPS